MSHTRGGVPGVTPCPGLPARGWRPAASAAPSGSRAAATGRVLSSEIGKAEAGAGGKRGRTAASGPAGGKLSGTGKKQTLGLENGTGPAAAGEKPGRGSGPSQGAWSPARCPGSGIPATAGEQTTVPNGLHVPVGVLLDLILTQNLDLKNGTALVVELGS